MPPPQPPWWVYELSYFSIRPWLPEVGTTVYLSHLTMPRQFSGKTLFMDKKNISKQLPLLEHKARGGGKVTNGPGTEEFSRT